MKKQKEKTDGKVVEYRNAAKIVSDDLQAVQVPEAIIAKENMATYGNYWNGGYANQPAVRLMEIEMAISAIVEYQDNKIEEMGGQQLLNEWYQKIASTPKDEG